MSDVILEVGKKYKTNSGVTVLVTRISEAFVGFPFCASDILDETPYRFSSDGIDYFDFGHKIVELVSEEN